MSHPNPKKPVQPSTQPGWPRLALPPFGIAGSFQPRWTEVGELLHCIHTYTHTHRQLHIHMHIHIHVHVYVHTYIHAYIHTYIQLARQLHTTHTRVLGGLGFCLLGWSSLFSSSVVLFLFLVYDAFSRGFVDAKGQWGRVFCLVLFSLSAGPRAQACVTLYIVFTRTHLRDSRLQLPSSLRILLDCKQFTEPGQWFTHAPSNVALLLGFPLMHLGRPAAAGLLWNFQQKQLSTHKKETQKGRWFCRDLLVGHPLFGFHQDSNHPWNNGPIYVHIYIYIYVNALSLVGLGMHLSFLDVLPFWDSSGLDPKVACLCCVLASMWRCTRSSRCCLQRHGGTLSSTSSECRPGGTGSPLFDCGSRLGWCCIFPRGTGRVLSRSLGCPLLCFCLALRNSVGGAGTVLGVSDSPWIGIWTRRHVLARDGESADRYHRHHDVFDLLGIEMARSRWALGDMAPPEVMWTSKCSWWPGGAGRWGLVCGWTPSTRATCRWMGVVPQAGQWPIGWGGIDMGLHLPCLRCGKIEGIGGDPSMLGLRGGFRV